MIVLSSLDDPFFGKITLLNLPKHVKHRVYSIGDDVKNIDSLKLSLSMVEQSVSKIQSDNITHILEGFLMVNP